MPHGPGADASAARAVAPRWWRVLVAVAASVAAVGVVEAGLRLADRDTPTFRIDDPLLGWKLRPGFAGWTSVENRVWVQINSDGLRDRERPLTAPPSTIRVAVLGDSYIQAMNVPFEKTFTSFLEARLAACASASGHSADVLNFGVSGYGTAQELLTFRHHVTRYKPDIVMLAMYLGNDVFDNHPDLHENPTPDVPFFANRDGALTRVPRADPGDHSGLPAYQRARLWLTEHSHAASAAWRGYAALRATAPPDAGPETDDTLSPSDEVFRPPSTPAIEEAWQLTERLLLALAREVADAGAEFWIVTLTTEEQVDPDVSHRAHFARQLGVDSLFYPDRRIRDFAHANGLHVVSLAEPLASHAAASGEFLHGGYNAAYPLGTGHWNEAANALAAGLVSEQLCRAPAFAGAGR